MLIRRERKRQKEMKIRYNIYNTSTYYRRFQNSVVQCRSLKKKIIMIIHENFEPVKIKYFSLVITYDFLAIFTTVGLFTAFL